MNLSFVFSVVLFICFMVLLYNVLFYNISANKIKNDDALLKLHLKENDAFVNLINTSGINNIPNLNLISTNVNVAKAASCAESPINIGSVGTLDDCIRLCANSNTKILDITDHDEMYYNSTQLKRGKNCIIGERPQCDVQNTIILMTANSIVCKPKFPNIIAGPLGTTIIACNNKIINDPQNILWDYKYNVKYDPLNSTITSEDELLSDNNFRFRCKFNGLDERNNKYQQHPYNRLHPVKNYCASLIYGAHPDVKTIYDVEKNTLICECGDVNETRVRNLIENDKSSQCSDKIVSVQTLFKEKKELSLVQKCFNLFSPITDVGKYLPCSDTKQFVKEGSQTQTIKIQFSTASADYAIEHPIYEKFPINGEIKILDGKVIC